MIKEEIERFESDASHKTVAPILILLSFIVGIGVGALLLSVFSSTATVLNGKQTVSSDISEYINEDYVEEVLEIFEERYLNELPDRNKASYGIIKGFISSLDDKYTSFLDPEEAEQYRESRDPSFDGIGVTLKFEEGYTKAETVLKGNPAESAGILPGDIVLEVEGEDMAGKFPAYVASKIRGEKNTQVKLKLYRESTPEVFEKTITRARIETTNISWEELDNGIFQIAISQFIDVSPSAFNDSWDKAVDEILAKNSNPKGIVVDLRGNPGGYVDSVKYVLEEFLSADQIMLIENSKIYGKVVYKDKRIGSLENIPVSVIVNEGSASASEIFATAIQENGRGKVVGKETVGKGVEQEVNDSFDDGSILVLVFQEWLTPRENRISEENPVKPDFDIELTEEQYAAGEDTQLNKAVEIISQ
jgi:carboxyl-terminal processing protease